MYEKTHWFFFSLPFMFEQEGFFLAHQYLDFCDTHMSEGSAPYRSSLPSSVDSSLTVQFGTGLPVFLLSFKAPMFWRDLPRTQPTNMPFNHMTSSVCSSHPAPPLHRALLPLNHIASSPYSSCPPIMSTLTPLRTLPLSSVHSILASPPYSCGPLIPLSCQCLQLLCFLQSPALDQPHQ